MKTLATLYIVLIAFAFLAFGSLAHAETPSSAISAPVCLLVSSNMRIGATDAATNGSVTALQNFLTSQGYFNSVYAGTGRFGPITYAAVVKFQAAHALPATGYVGPLTRSLIASLGCSGTPTTNVSLYTETPTAGGVGTTVTLTGFGFTKSNTILMDGNVAARNVPIDSSIAIACTTSSNCHGGINQTIHFTVPGSLSPNCPTGSMCPMYMRITTPGAYSVTVMNENGTSNALNFTVTGSSATPTTY